MAVAQNARRLNVLDPVIDRAVRDSKSMKTRPVWEVMTAMAHQEAPPEPLLGYVPDKGIAFKGTTWERSGGKEQDVLTFRALHARLWRRGKVPER